MSKSLKTIREPIKNEIIIFDQHFKRAMKSRVPLLDKVTYYLVQRKGKQVRPMFVFLSAKMLGEINDSSYIAASLIELLHTATIVHDDVVDDSLKRRNFFSINALWKNKIAVLVGDYLLSKGMLLALENDEFQTLKIVSRAIKQIIEGELLQFDKARKLDIREEDYYKIIRMKTASLIAASCSVGAYSVNKDPEIRDLMWEFGENLGIAFQIKDDLFDYGSKNIGKPIGIDIKEKKLTLPLIHVIQKASSKEKSWILNIIRKHNNDKKKVQDLIGYVKENGGLEYATDIMNEYKNKALEMIQHIPESPAYYSMVDLIHFVVDRKK